MTYGAEPKFLGMFDDIEPEEMMAYLYLPISLAGSTDIVVTQRLGLYEPLIGQVIQDDPEAARDKIIYLTAKTLHVTKENPGNRPGWHVDGWGSDGDVNYIWCDRGPTEFAVGTFGPIPDDDASSMLEMERQIYQRRGHEIAIAEYPVKGLLRLDESVVHRVSPSIPSGMRTFVKISVSEHRYNLIGNSRNWDLDYDWEMHDRAELRNTDNSDFV